MSIHISQVLDYLDSYLVCQKAEDMPSLMKMLKDAYTLFEYPDEESAEVLAFSQGILTGMLLMTEVNRLP